MMDPQDAIHSESDGPPTLGRKVTVYGSVIVTVLLALALIAATGVRWMTQPTPSSIVVFHANASLAGATITILSGQGSPERTAKIAGEPDFTTPVFLEPGSYTVTVKHAGGLAYHDTMYVAAGSRYDIDVVASKVTKP